MHGLLTGLQPVRGLINRFAGALEPLAASPYHLRMPRVSYLILVAGAWVLGSAQLSAQEPVFRISEFLAVNDNGFEDQDGDRPDWVEIENLTDASQNLSDWYLSDDPDNPTKWKAPSFRVPETGFRLLLASGKDKHSIFQRDVHMNFSLSRSAGFLSLANPDGEIVQTIAYPAQRTDVAYGFDASGEIGFMTPTSEASNGGLLLGEVADTKFSVDRGFYSEAFEVAITTETEGARILYTIDGAVPDQGTLFGGQVGDVYEGPIRIDQTTTLRAAAFKEGHLSSNVDTHTYIFAEQVIRQPNDPPGFPDRWVNFPADYGMDARVVDDPAYRDEIVDGLTSIPSMSVVMPVDELFGRERGIYARSSDRGPESERAASVELIHPDGSRGFQEDCGVRVHGFGWRDHNNTRKHSLRLEFRERYGKTKLDYPLFPDAPVERFDSIVLRSQGSKGWQDFRDPEQSQYLHDTFARDLAREMGKVDGHATYVHLYLNGLYWGLFNPVERPDADFAAEYFGGDAEDYDAVNRRTTTNEAIDGDLEAYNEMIALAQSGVRSLEDYEAIQEYLDIDDLIDYMLIHQYTTNRDGPEEFNSNNMRGVRRREPGAQFRFFVWDMEYSLWNVERNINIDVAIPGSISFVYSRLRNSPEFRLRYADHAHKHLFNDGALTPDRVLAIWNQRTDEIFSALIGESARWGDAKRPNNPYTRDAEWAEERRRLVEEYFPFRTRILIDQLQDAELYPEVQAPEFNQHGGRVGIDFRLTMTAGQLFNPQGGDFYYTTDGTDPREYGSSDVSSAAQLYDRSGDGVAIDESLTIRARTWDQGEWSALNEATFIAAVAPTSDTLILSEIHYHPAAPSEVELAAGHTTRSAFEFLELHNPGDQAIDLTGVHFARGLTASIEVLDLAPGATGLLVRDREAFAKRYGPDLPVIGTFAQSRLANEGETLTLALSDGVVLHEIPYDDASPWPTAADGEGFSLTLINVNDSESLGEASAWRASSKVGGSPGKIEIDTSSTSPVMTLHLEPRLVDGLTNDFWILEIGMETTSYVLELSDDLLSWRLNESEFVKESEPPAITRFRSRNPASNQIKKTLFARLRFDQ